MKWSNLALAVITVTAVLIYTASPIDIIPDVVPMFGYADDATAVVLGSLAVHRLLRGVDAFG